MTILKWLVILVSIGYLGGLAVLFFKQRDFLFPIPQTVRTAPEAAGLAEAEEHILPTADGEKVIVWHVPAKPGHAVVLYFPGNGDFLAGSVSRFRDIASGGTGLVALSYRGYAGSTGQPSEPGLLQDAAAAYGFTSARYSADRIVVWGFSLGTGVAVALAAEQPVGKLILEAPYTSMADVAALHFQMANAISPFQSGSASACLRSPASRSSSSGFPKVATTIWEIMVQLKPPGSSSAA
jgi:fermentation-respiration switch protein FrsA (DUF1100 family)